jgi:hypothetical protein
MWAEESTDRKWFFPVRMNRSALLARWLKVERRDTLILDGGRGGLEEDGEIGRDFVVEADVREAMLITR